MSRPDAAQAYADAPEAAVEIQALMNLARATAGTPLGEVREWVLRSGALSDRTALLGTAGADALGEHLAAASNEQAAGDAVRAGYELMELDRRDGTGRGPLGPDAAEWDGEGGTLGYLRQEYRTWRSAQLGDTRAAGKVMRAATTVADDSTLARQAADRGEPWPHERLVDLARRKVDVYRRAVDYGLGAECVADQHRAEKELRELEGDAGGHARA
ncbi:hypothetical protein [Kitasatospora cineracea]|uniref:Uncharacterized protein n=1 Tax=Kitasatospora cineracea TaxID=88074 RepID=A0A3N4RHK5_9ACTN|nr:hypothetical protein [Kitasatospora cineracea]RPE26590.1 hypothetical protein EDD38_7651 [Kitasatospora cineracea]